MWTSVGNVFPCACSVKARLHSVTVILAHRESPQQEVGRSEGWQPLLCVYGQYQESGSL